MDNVRQYVLPTLKIHPNLAAAREDFVTGIPSLLDEQEQTEVRDLLRAKRNLIIGTPGIGKTRLLHEMKSVASSLNLHAAFVSLRNDTAAQEIQDFVAVDEEPDERLLLLDGLDEISLPRISSFLRLIYDIADKRPQLTICLSSRWDFVNKYESSLPSGFRVISIAPLSMRQVRTFLRGAGFENPQIEAFLTKAFSFGHQKYVVQTPRYLELLIDYFKDKNISDFAKVSRNEIFDRFIESKLLVEDARLDQEKRFVVRRILEKLALVMEIYQTNAISKADFIIFLELLDSDLKTILFTQIPIEIFWRKSLLIDDVEKGTLSFENTEFQEFLAAKELSLLEHPIRTAADCAIDPNIREIYPSWFNMLTFLADFHAELIPAIVEFSEVKTTAKSVDELFFTFLSRVDPRRLTRKSKIDIFHAVFEYHQRTLQWVSLELAYALPGFFEMDSMDLLKRYGEKTTFGTETERSVQLANLAYVVGALFLHGRISSDPVQTCYWRQKLLGYVISKDNHGVLQRHALEALQYLGDPSIIDELPDLTEGDELVARVFLTACAELGPNHAKSIGYFIKALASGNYYGRYGIHKITNADGLARVLRELLGNPTFLREFLARSQMFDESDVQIVEHLTTVYNETIGQLCEEFVLKASHHDVAPYVENTDLILGIFRLLKERKQDFIKVFVSKLLDAEHNQADWFYARRNLVDLLTTEADVAVFLETMKSCHAGELAFWTMRALRSSPRPEAKALYECGRTILPEEYTKGESLPEQLPGKDLAREQEETIARFRDLLEPEKGKYSPAVFAYFVRHARFLLPLPEDCRSRFASLITETIFRHVDPIEHPLTINDEQDGTSSFTTSQAISLFGSALEAARIFKLDVEPYRQQIIHFIPFAFHEQLTAIFELMTEIRAEEIKQLLTVYAERSSDLWRHRPESFLQLVERYQLTNAVPILKNFVEEVRYQNYVRERALEIVESLEPNITFLRHVFEKYRNSQEEDQLANLANGLLITTYGDAEALHWRLQKIKERITPFKSAAGVYAISNLEDELTISKPFARSLMALSHGGFEDEYIDLLKESFTLWKKGESYYAYSQYLWDIVFAYFNNLKQYRSYQPLQQLEEVVRQLGDREGVNWFLARLGALRRNYLTEIGKPPNITSATRRYNAIAKREGTIVSTSKDLFELLQDIIEDKIRLWVEGEGAYQLIAAEEILSHSKKKQPREELVQKTIKAQIENVLLKSHLRDFDIMREAQLLDGKKPDFLIRYGFVGPIVLEVKLSSNQDLHRHDLTTAESFKSMQRYMRGFGAEHGIFLVMINESKPLSSDAIHRAYSSIDGVKVIFIRCVSSSGSATKPKAKRTKQKVTRKRPVSQRRS